MTEQRLTVLIVGAGPTGMTAALALAADGVPVRIIDRRPQPSDSSRALGLQARSMEVLHGLGVAERIERVADRLQGAAVMRGDRPLVELGWVPPQSRYPYTYVVPQAGVEAILRERLDELGVTVERDVELAGIVQHASGVTATLIGAGGERTVEAAWLVGADGARSAVREMAGIGFPEQATGEVYQLADVLLEADGGFGSRAAGSAMWLGPEGPFMLMRLPVPVGSDAPVGAAGPGGHPWRIFADVTDAARRGEVAEPTAAELDALLAARGPSGVRVASLQWRSVFRTRIGLADRYRAGRVLLAGDAAHVFPPFGGQGMNLGIQDAVNLAWRIAAVTRGAEEALVDGYERERRPVAAATIRDVEARRRLFALRHPLARWARDQLLRLGGGSRRAEQRASLQNSQLATSYRDRTPGGDRGPDPRPGDRLPHAAVAGTTTHELVGPAHTTLLVADPTGDGPAIERAGRVVTLRLTEQTDAGGGLRRQLGFGAGEGGWLLVRPDGVVAARGSGAGPGAATLEAALSRAARAAPSGSRGTPHDPRA